MTAPVKLTRAEEIAQGRRRRNPSEDMNGLRLRLGVDADLKDPDFEHHWFNDDRGRLELATHQDDWDFVKHPEIAKDDRNLNESESRIRRVVGQNEAGGPLYAYYCRKYKPWYDEDQKQLAAAATAERRALIKKQHVDSKGVASDAPDVLYIPKEAQRAIARTEKSELRESKIRRSTEI